MKNPSFSPEAALLYLPSPDGHRIPIRHWPVTRPRAVIHIVHGMAEHSGNYDDVAALLNQHGFAVLAHDHRCHGLAVGAGRLGDVDRLQHWQGILHDMPLINNWIRATYAGVPIGLLAHSMGSFISQWFIQHYPGRVNALAISGSDYSPPWFLRIPARVAALETFREGGNGRSDLIHNLAFGKFNKVFGATRTDFDWLSRDPAFVDKYVADPFCGFRMANRYWRDFLTTLAEVYTPENMKRVQPGLPVYLFAGTHDPVGHMGKGVRKLARMHHRVGRAQVTLKLYPHARHDTLHETNAAEVRQDLLAWLDAVFPAVAEPVPAARARA